MSLEDLLPMSSDHTLAVSNVITLFISDYRQLDSQCDKTKFFC